MKKAIMNKNVHHNGILYATGKQINEGDEGFEGLVKAGHAKIIGGDEVEAQAEGEVQPSEQPVEQPKSKGKPSK